MCGLMSAQGARVVVVGVWQAFEEHQLSLCHPPRRAAAAQANAAPPVQPLRTSGSTASELRTMVASASEPYVTRPVLQGVEVEAAVSRPWQRRQQWRRRQRRQGLCLHWAVQQRVHVGRSSATSHPSNAQGERLLRVHDAGLQAVCLHALGTRLCCSFLLPIRRHAADQSPRMRHCLRVRDGLSAGTSLCCVLIDHCRVDGQWVY